MGKRKKLRTFTVCGEVRAAFSVQVEASSEDEASQIVQDDPSLAFDNLDGGCEDLSIEDVIDEGD